MIGWRRTTSSVTSDYVSESSILASFDSTPHFSRFSKHRERNGVVTGTSKRSHNTIGAVRHRVSRIRILGSKRQEQITLRQIQGQNNNSVSIGVNIPCLLTLNGSRVEGLLPTVAHLPREQGYGFGKRIGLRIRNGSVFGEHKQVATGFRVTKWLYNSTALTLCLLPVLYEWAIGKAGQLERSTSSTDDALVALKT